MNTRKLKRKLQQNFGKIPDPYYFHGDMEYIRAYYDFRRDTGRDAFLIDDTTWNDLDMDRVFKRINPSLSTSGEQYLYYMLRSPTIDEEEYQKRKTLIDCVAANPELRLKLQVILARLGCTRRADLCTAFHPANHGFARLFLYLLLLLLVPLAVVSVFLFPSYGVVMLALVFTVNSIVHETVKRKIEKDFDTVNYSVSMIFALHKIRKLHAPMLDAHLQPAYTALDRLRSVIRTGGVSTVPDHSGAGDMVTMVLLLDLIAYEFLKNKLGRNHEDVFAVHEHLGKIDAAIAIASFRKSMNSYVEPILDFSCETSAYLCIGQMVHPLLDSAVPNDVFTKRSLLITGSNASGKSTFLKTAALCALMSQSICTCTAGSYRARVFRIFSSMALSDDLLAGESYYMVEIRSLKRIMDAVRGDQPVLCVVDEVLRGTNTVERIAASCEVMKSLAEHNTLCLAASHDIELCDLLGQAYSLYHFDEQMGEKGMTFDYKLHEGRATSRNAINLLAAMGFEKEIVQGAHERADRFLSTGAWQ